ncbi:MAG: phosphocholine cytidylyltransferase family protein [Candidatus Marinimicrobia bacterium]|nr:phosphocholine cytidylyltransferase family protein [Candidatus Neomarinimicrobiota bacterium]
MSKTAVVLAAGRGRRLKELTEDQPKPMVEIHGKSIISNLVEKLIESGLEKIVLLIGYKADMMRQHLQPFREKTDLVFLENESYATTNNIYTLWLAEKHLQEGFFLFEADIFCENSLLQNLTDSPHENVIVADKFTDRMNGTVIRFDEITKKVLGMYLGKDQGVNFDYSDAYKTVNFYKLGKNYVREFFLPRLRHHIECKNLDAYYELIIHESLQKNADFVCQTTGTGKWWEIDNEEDLRFARNLFRP